MKTLSFHQQAKAVAMFLAIILSGTFSQAQDITGQWNGLLSVQGINLRLVFHINKSGEGYTSTMDSPDQNATGLPVATTTFNGSKISLAAPQMGLSYEGEFKTDSITGTFKQGPLSVPMTLKRTPAVVKAPNRPQEPKPPYPYRSEEVSFENKAAGIVLAGTLTMPATGSNFTTVILITGSGAQNRDQEIMGHKPFLVIADYLTRHGIAVLRYDDRGTAKSTGNFATSTTADFAADAESAIAYLKTRKEINQKKIGLIGHSEGGVIAPMIAARSNDVGFIVLLAGSGLRGDALLLLQQELIYRVSGIPETQIAGILKNNAKVMDKVTSANGMVSLQEIIDFMTTLRAEFAGVVPGGISVDDYIKQYAVGMSSPWMQYLLRLDPAPTLEKVKCPVLAINGSKDLQVPPNENLSAISNALKKGGNNRVTTKEYPNLNHLFQTCITGSPAEYATIEQTFSPDVLKDLVEWISQTIK